MNVLTRLAVPVAALAVVLAGCTDTDDDTSDETYGLTSAQALRVAVVRGDRPATEALLAEGADVNDEAMGTTLLHIAVEAGDAAMVQLLVAEGIDVEAVRLHRHRAIHIAAAAGYTDIVRVLLEAGADPSPVSEGGWGNQATPLDLAAEFGKLDAMQVLLDAGADPNLTTADGHHPVRSAACGGHETALRLLLDSGAEIPEPEEPGEESPAVECAVTEGHLEVAALLRSLA